MELICPHCLSWLLDWGKVFKKCIGCGFYKMKNELIGLESYKMGRDTQYPKEWTKEVEDNAKKLLINVNAFLNELEIKQASVSSGWRPQAINSATPGAAKKSAHTTGEAVDIKDADGKLKEKVLTNVDLLKKYGLWMEHQDSTPTWLHLDIRERSQRDKNIFKP